MSARLSHDALVGLSVDRDLRAFVEGELLPAVGLKEESFWTGLAATIEALAPRYRKAMEDRNETQRQIDVWLAARKGQAIDGAEYESFLRNIGYLVPEPAPDAYRVATKHVDAEIGVLRGIQVVAPLSDPNAVLAAVNSRWISAGAEGIPLIDQLAPLREGNHREAVDYAVLAGRLRITLASGAITELRVSGQCAGFVGPSHAPTAILFARDGRHVEMVLDRSSERLESRGLIADVVIEAALTAILDLDDTAVIATTAEKISAYRTWLELMTGTFVVCDAVPAEDRVYVRPQGGALTLPGRPLQLVRNTGHHSFTDTVLDSAGQPIPEGILDAVITVACALPDLRGETSPRNSRCGSVYVIKPKMHGPDDLGIADGLFKFTEETLGLPRYTMKIGIADEARRTSLNLAACMSKVRDRTAVTYTDRLGRTGDNLFEDREAGVLAPLEQAMDGPWANAFEDNNVAVGLRHDLPGHAMVAKSRWDGANGQVPPTTFSWQVRVGPDLPAQALMFAGVSEAGALGTVPAKQPHVAAQLESRGSATSLDDAGLDRCMATVLSQVAQWIAPGTGPNGAAPFAHTVLRAAALSIFTALQTGAVDSVKVKGAIDRLAARDGHVDTTRAVAEEVVTSIGHLTSGYVDGLLRQRRREMLA